MDKIIFDALKNSQIELLIYTGIIFFIVWLYKEFRNTKVEYEKLNTERVDKALELYGELQLEISLYLSNQSDSKSLRQKLSKIYPYLPYKHLKLIMDWNMKEENDYLTQLLSNLEKEIKFLKSLQYDKINFRSNDNFIEDIQYVLNKIKLNTFVYPFVYTFFSIVSITLLLEFSFLFNAASVKNKILIIFVVFNFILLLILISLILQAIFQNRFIFNKKNIVIFIIMVAVPTCLTFTGHIFITIIGTPLLLLYILFFFKKKHIES